MPSDIEVINSFNKIAALNEKNRDTNNKYYTRLLNLCTNPTSKVLDIGCGDGKFIRLATERGYMCTGIDFSSEMIKKAKKENSDILKKADFICGNAYDVLQTIPANSIDAAYSFAAMHHMDYLKVIPLLSKCIKKGGFFAALDLYKVSTLIDYLACGVAIIPNKIKNSVFNKKSDLSPNHSKIWDEHWKLDKDLLSTLNEVKLQIRSTGFKFQLKRLFYFRYMLIVHF